MTDSENQYIEQTVTHVYENTRYEVQFEQGATKGVIGWKVQAHGDDKDKTFAEALDLMTQAIAEVSIRCGEITQ